LCLLWLSFALIGYGQTHRIPPLPHEPVPPPAAPPPPTGESHVRMNVDVDRNKVTAVAATAFPRNVGWENNDVKVTFQLESGPTAYIYPPQGNDPAHLGIVATYTGDVETKSFAFGCHLHLVHPFPYIRIYPGLEQVGNTWNIGAADVKAQIGLRQDSDVTCLGGPFSRNVEPQVLNALNGSAQFSQVIQSLTDKVRIREHYIQGWIDFAAPQAFSTGSANELLCVYPRISSIATGPVKPKGNSAEMVVSFEMSPITQLAASCPAGVTQPIDLKPGTTDLAPGVDLHATLPMLYSDLSPKMEAKLTGISRLQLESRPFQVTKASVKDARGRVLVALDLAGQIDGRAYFWGTPGLNAANSAIVFPDLQLADESRNAIESLKPGLANLFVNAVRDRVIQASEIDISEAVAKVQRALDGTHPDQKTSLNIQLSAADPESVYSTPAAIFVGLHIAGSADLSIVQF
jgi:Domain of unknown function (DUF4403)